MRKTIGNRSVLFGVLISAVLFASIARPHCQIPCGIYNDQARFDMMSEHISTIEKSMKTIISLSKADKPDMNQIVRWVQNKDKHADETSHIITYYFMAQRVKPTVKTNVKAYNEYVTKLVLLHQMLVVSMKSKQTTDLTNVEKFRALLDEFHVAYFGEHSHSNHKH